MYKRQPLGGRKPKGRLGGCVRAVSVLLTWLVIGVLVYLLASVLLPELYKSVINLMGNVETYYNTINGWVRQLLDSNPELETLVSDRLKGYYTDITTWLDTLLPQATALMSAVSGGVVSALNFLLDLLVGVIVSIFLLATKEQCAAYARKVIFGLFSESSVPWVLRGIHKVDSIFSGFVRGKLLDSLIKMCIRDSTGSFGCPFNCGCRMVRPGICIPIFCSTCQVSSLFIESAQSKVKRRFSNVNIVHPVAMPACSQRQFRSPIGCVFSWGTRQRMGSSPLYPRKQ